MSERRRDLSDDEARRRDELHERLFGAAVGMFDILALYLGERLGLYRALANGEAVTSKELSVASGTNERYVREWLEQQAVTGILEVDDAAADPADRRYRLPAGHAEVLADEDSLFYKAHAGVDMVRAARPMPELVEAFRTGAGLAPLPWEPEGRAEFNRAIFLNLLGRVWLPAIADVDARLRADPPARVADLGCGSGWASIALAQAYPKAIVDGFDLYEPVVDLARANAKDAGVSDRVAFHVLDVSGEGLAGSYDLAMILEALHDMPRPVEALRNVLRLLSKDGSLIVADERVGDSFTAPSDDHERYAYGWSVVSCLPSAMGDPESAGTGAVMRPDTLRRYAKEAGFGQVRLLPIEDKFWRFYQLVR
jgi:SAM-dependent methyltransferase